jgi:hypothetical protein
MTNDIKNFMRLVESIQNGTDSKEKQSFVEQYLLTALWSSNDTDPNTGEDVSLDNYVFSDECKRILSEFATEFFQKHYQLISDFSEEEKVDVATTGHKLWLSHNGHGAGFFDYNGESAKKLQELSNTLKQFDLYIGDDGLVYC